MPKPDRASWICLSILTDLGEFRASYSKAGLTELRFPSDNRASTVTPLAPASSRIQRWHRVTTQAVNQILMGRKPKAFPPFDLSAGTEFQQSVWLAMAKIPFGQTTSYGELADVIGKPKAVRAVGGACGANPIPVLVPCHRVLGANNKIGGFSSGLDRKRELLKRERITLI
jgi:methylated-DNA-[protein]-cysteine S-methyltransferase